jgi:hypothetical protein
VGKNMNGGDGVAEGLWVRVTVGWGPAIGAVAEGGMSSVGGTDVVGIRVHAAAKAIRMVVQ